MSQHLQFVKWKESAFSTEQLKGVRWLLGARPKNIPEALHEALTVTPTAQKMLMDLHVKRFGQATRRVKASARRFARSSPEDFEKLVDYACVFAYLRQSAKQATSDPKVDDKLVEAFMARSFSLFDFFSPFLIALKGIAHTLSCQGLLPRHRSSGGLEESGLPASILDRLDGLGGATGVAKLSSRRRIS